MQHSNRNTCDRCGEIYPHITFSGDRDLVYLGVINGMDYLQPGINEESRR
jgi:hypothetical protein